MPSDSEEAVLWLSATWRIRHGRYEWTIRYGGGLGSKTDWEEGIRGVRGTTFAVGPRGQRGMHASRNCLHWNQSTTPKLPSREEFLAERLAGRISRCQGNAQIPASCEPFGRPLTWPGICPERKCSSPGGLTPNRLAMARISIPGLKHPSTECRS